MYGLTTTSQKPERLAPILVHLFPKRNLLHAFREVYLLMVMTNLPIHHWKKRYSKETALQLPPRIHTPFPNKKQDQ